MSEELRDWPSKESALEYVPSTVNMRIHVPTAQSRLTVNEGLRIDFPVAQPNAWWRFWQWLLLGWRWENAKGSR